jgi:hypothetical protein
MAPYSSGYGHAPASQEPVFFQSARGARGEYVSRSRVVLNGVTFPVNGITVVYIRKIPESIATIVFGVLLMLNGVSCAGCGAATPDTNGALIGFGILEAIAAAGLLALYIWVQKDRYALVIATAGREINAMVSYDWLFVGTLLQAINDALASRA